MARRVKKVWGDGAVFEYPEGSGIWWAQLAPDEQGRRPKRRAKSEAEAHEKLRELNAKREQKINITVRNPTVAQFLDTWLDDVVKGSGSVKYSTLVSYKQICRLYLTPRLGRIRLEELTTAQIQRTVNDLNNETSSLTARNAYARIRAALDVAVQWRYITFNPAFGVKLPKLPSDEPEPPSVEQVRKLLHIVESHRIGSLYHLAILGPRKGEVLGVRWADLDWDKAELKITQQVSTFGAPHPRKAARS